VLALGRERRTPVSWSILIGIVLALGLAVGAALQRRHVERRTRETVRGMASARERGTAQARLQYPHVDLARCLGCGTCVAACPEDGVLAMSHGQAVVVHGARCVGHGRCAEECPTGAIAVRLGDISDRRDIPVLTEGLEADGVPGLFLAGEVTGFALIRTAIEHGRAVAAEVARRVQGREAGGMVDLCIVGAGPAGIACSLEAKARGLDFVMVDQEELGGTVAKYPRRKLVMTQPVELPLLGRLKRTSYTKEELMELWHDVAKQHALPLRGGVRMKGLVRDGAGFRVDTDAGAIPARNVCLALGRRGTPRKLGVPGEELSKVAYSLLDACSYQGRRVLVVGGGDSAVEAALGLAEQPGNRVTLSYRKDGFSRLRPRNEERVREAQRAGEVRVLFQSQVARIDADSVTLHVAGEAACEGLLLENDEVFVLIGGEPPFPLLESCGVSFDPALRAAPETLESGRGSLVGPLGVALLGALVALVGVAALSDYYGLDAHARARHGLDPWLRSSGRVGLPLGIGAACLVLANLAYLLRRSGRIGTRCGALSTWMTTHVVTGILALVTAILHAAMAPGHTVGGHALLGLCVLVTTGAIGRWFYSFVPRAANGRELALVEVQGRLAALAGEWDRANPEFATRVRGEIDRLIGGSAWRGSFLTRLGELLRARRRVRAVVLGLVRDARAAGLAEEHVAELRRLSTEAQRAALTAAHYEDVRGLLASWRYLHRWFALLMVLLLAAHVVTALRYAEVFR
jgi:thioredoxin reductase